MSMGAKYDMSVSIGEQVDSGKHVIHLFTYDSLANCYEYVRVCKICLVRIDR